MQHQCVQGRSSGSSNGSCSEGFGAFEGAKGQFRKPPKTLLGLLGGSLGRCRRSFLGLHGGCLGAARVPEKVVVVGAASRQYWKRGAARV